ncbi:cyclohexanone monooxygenase [Gordonia amarae]|nr:NAD(P)/FAD-dependent oxidoreductase [Gordonia amarae]MCS3880708.1 cyclohexanone monooxygenase [Gordonia amarae]GAB04780.1 putative Baeyer-Villiger monooxygenase [Gordonia amarae NBRC 15530]
MSKVMDALAPTLPFDHDAIREKYQAERDKRVRTDGEAQFNAVDVSGEYAEYLTHDPFAPQPEPREALTDTIEVAIVGGGWVGLMLGARLTQQGVTDFRIIDSAADFGGTWYWNRYPGAHCDIESYSYLPLLDETGYVPRERYASAPEIFEHAQRIGKHFDLYGKAVFQTWVTEARWDEDARLWTVETNRGDKMRAKYLALATGPASRPRLPGIPGIHDYQGPSFHTCRWDYSVTGGAPGEPMTDLADKKVAVIGTGSTGIQAIPRLAQDAGHLYVFQRTPSSVDFRNNRPTDPEWAATLEPGWQKRRMDAFNAAMLGAGPIDGPEGDFTDDGWMRPIQSVTGLAAQLDDPAVLGEPGELDDLIDLSDDQTMERIRARVDSDITDPAVRDKLKAWYKQFCKRPTFSDEYLPTFNRDNVTLVDVAESKGIDRIDATGIVANGEHYDVDLIVYASGFEITSDFKRRMGIPVFGSDGQSLYDHWGDGMRAFQSHSTYGFPNMFIVGGLFPFGFGANYCSSVDDISGHVAYIIAEADKRGASRVEVTQETENGWVQTQVDSDGGIAKNLGGAETSCTPGYYNQEGAEVKSRNWKQEQYWGTVIEFGRLLQDWRTDGKLEGFNLR